MSSTFAISAPRIFDGNMWHDDSAILVDGECVKAIVKQSDLPSDIEIETLDSGYIAPGFVDLQVNGGGGVLFNNDPSVEGIRTICAAHAKFGTTSLLPTLITDLPEIRDTAIAAGVEATKVKVPGFAGLHLEGPHLSQARKGAHDPDLVRPMNGDDVAALIAARKDLPVLVTTLAPESATPDQVRALTAGGVKVSVGHSDATMTQVLELVDAGASMITHLFNAMSQMTGREPGMVGAALSSGDLNVGMIADGYHVHPTSMSLACRAKVGPGKMFLISDAMSTVGTDITELVLNGRTIQRAEGKLTLEDGTLAGADLDMATAVRILIDKVGIDLDEVLRMASLYPADIVGLSGVGRIATGGVANFICMGPGDSPVANRFTRAWINGVPV